MGCGASQDAAVLPREKSIAREGRPKTSPRGSPVFSLCSDSSSTHSIDDAVDRSQDPSPPAGFKAESFRAKDRSWQSSSLNSSSRMRSDSPGEGGKLRSQSYSVVEKGAQKERQRKARGSSSGWTKVRLAAATNSAEPDAGLFVAEAARCGRTEDIMRLLEEGANASEADALSGATPLYFAARENHVPAMAALVDTGGAQLNKRDKLGMTPLMIAADRGSVEAVEWLLARGADWRKTATGDEYLNMNALDCAKRRDDTSTASPHRCIVAMLLKAEEAHDARRMDALNSRLRGAAGNGNVAEVRRLIDDEGADVDGMDIHGITPLEWALRRNHQETVEVLMLRGADITRFPCTAETPLMVAAQCGAIDCIEFLLPQGAEWSDVAKTTGKTALEYAREAREEEAATILEAWQCKQQEHAKTKLLRTKSLDMPGGRAWNAKIGDEYASGRGSGKRRSRRGSVERFMETIKALKKPMGRPSGANVDQ